MAKIILQGNVKGARRRRRQKQRCEDNTKELTGMRIAAEDKERWKGFVAASFVAPRRPSRLKD